MPIHLLCYNGLVNKADHRMWLHMQKCKAVLRALLLGLLAHLLCYCHLVSKADSLLSLHVTMHSCIRGTVAWLTCTPAGQPNSCAIGRIAMLMQILSMLQRRRANAVGPTTLKNAEAAAQSKCIVCLQRRQDAVALARPYPRLADPCFACCLLQLLRLPVL